MAAPAFFVWLVALLVLLACHTGQMFFDTKLGVDIDPLGFYRQLWQLWNPWEWLGTLQDQYIGYAFPMAPFYLVGQLLKVPVWLTERLWLSVLIAAGFGGLVKLAGALGIGSARSRLVAGLVFVLWPTFTIVIGSTSAGIIPGLVAPWAVLPLVSAARGGSLPKAAARSGIAVLFMGGVNAASTTEALVLPVMFILTELTGRRRVQLAACWAGAAALATSWWVAPLILQARYAFNFLPYVEQSATTTGTMSAASFLRGSGNWTAYLNFGQPWLSGGWATVTYPLPVLAGAIAAGTGLLGLSRTDLRWSRWLRSALGVAVLIALAGYPGPLGGVFYPAVDRLMNAGLAPLRSVYKVEPVAAAVLALGIAHALALTRGRVAAVRDPADGLIRRLLLTPVIALVLVGLAYPYLSGQVLNSGSFRAVPRYWYQVARYLRAHSPRAPALVVPAVAHADFLWGQPIDDPLEPLARSPWVAQGLVPYGGPGSQLLISSLVAAISSGGPVAGLAGTLARSGIRFVVVRNDLNPSVIGYTPPEAVHQTMLTSGFRRVAAFGPLVTSAQTDPGHPQIQYAEPSYRAVEIFVARSALGQAPPAAAVALPVSQTVLADGGPDALLQLTGQRIVTSQPIVTAGDTLVTRPALWAVTDSVRRADHAFGLIGDAASYTYTATETNPVDDPLGGAGGPPRLLDPVPGTGHQTVAVLSGAASVTASSAGSWTGETSQFDPVNAFDGDPRTAWVEASPVTAVGQWVQIRFDHPMSLPDTIGVNLLDDNPLRAVASALTVSTATGTVTSAMRRTQATQPLRVPPGTTRWLRITISGVRGGVAGGLGAGLSSVIIRGVTVTRFLRPPESDAGKYAPVTAFSFSRQIPSPASLADVTAFPPLARTFETRAERAFHLAATAIAVPGRALDALLRRLTPRRKHMLVVTANSTLGSLPSLAPTGLFSGGTPGSWIAGGPDPTIRLRWSGKRLVRQLIIQPVPGFSAAPEVIEISSPDGIRFASVGLDGITEIVPPLSANRMAISFPVVRYDPAAQPASGRVAQLPVGLSRLTIPALADLRVSAPDPKARFSLPCGSGPRLTVDGRGYPTRVSGNVGELIRFQPVMVEFCTRDSVLRLAGGQHWLLAGRTGPFSITGVSLSGSGSAVTHGRRPAAGGLRDGGPVREVRILGWQAESRQVRIGPGPASYLELHQNASRGWTATMNGRSLQPVRLDGWQQGYVVPAGQGGVVSLSFEPTPYYHSWIFLSVLGVMILLAGAFAGRPRRVPGGSARALPGPDSREGALALGGRYQAGWQVPADTRRGAVTAWLGLLAVSALILVVGGPMALAAPALAVLAASKPRWPGVLALVAMTAVGVITVYAAHPAQIGIGAFGASAQACALIALTAALTPALPGRIRLIPRRSHPPIGWSAGQDLRGAGVRPARTRFAVPDELSCYYDRASEPANVHLEVRVPGGLDELAFRAAVLSVLAAEPRLLARRVVAGRWRQQYEWEGRAVPDADPVRVVSWADEADLARQRDAFLSVSPSLDTAPPLRFLLASGPDADHVILNAHHAALDGRSCLALVRAVARHYGWPASRPPGDADRGSADRGSADRGSAGQGSAGQVGAGRGDQADGGDTEVGTVARQRTAGSAARGIAATLARIGSGAVSRIAPRPDSGQPGSRPGYGAFLVRWDGVDVAAEQLRARGASVNDLLIAVLAVAIRRWNDSCGKRPARIRITMPIGGQRTDSPAGGWGNQSRLTAITARVPAGAGAGELLAGVARQTRYAKDHPGPQVDLPARALAAIPVPVAVKRSLLAVALRLPGPVYCDTSLLSNLGVVEALRFGSTTATEVWFSTSAHMPRGLSIGVVTVGDQVRLTFRYRRALFCDAAAAEFAGVYQQVLQEFRSQQGLA
ncbi:MAG TPA: alpha-(1-_3)-arabinofuranosyltransferase family protein [Streptosporangiaceae bacterium]|nr:alpha-(1->3)-arabinofuranosyltransferase family protein [Streptosporangiaceae bacterium]